MLLDEVPRKGEPESKPTVLPGRPAVGLAESIEDVRQKLRIDAGAGVANLDQDSAFTRRAADGDPAALWRELDGI